MIDLISFHGAAHALEPALPHKEATLWGREQPQNQDQGELLIPENTQLPVFLPFRNQVSDGGKLTKSQAQVALYLQYIRAQVHTQ